MFDKFAISCICTYSKAKAKLQKFGKSEEGMETLETVILIGIAVIIAGFIINFLTQGQFGEEGEHGLIGYMFSKIGKSITKIFTTDTTVNPGLGGDASTPG